MDLNKVWEDIEKNWDSIQQAFRLYLDVDSHEMFNDDGELVASGRPMLESIICDKIDRKRRFFYYLVHCDPSLREEFGGIGIEDTGNGRVIRVGTRNRIPITFGGKQDVT